MKKKTLLSLIVYVVVLVYSYIYYVSPIFDYSGLIYNPSREKFFIAQSFTLILFGIMKFRDLPSTNLIYILFISLYIPLVNFYWLTSEKVTYVLYFTLFFFLLIMAHNYLKPFKVERLPIYSKIDIENIFFVISSVVFLFFIIKYGGFDVRSLDLTRVYEIRSEQSFTGMWGYLFNWLSKVFVPMMAVIGYFKRKYIILFSAIVMQIALYSSTGSKTLLFSVFFILAGCILLEKNKFTYGITYIYTALTILGILFYKFFNSIVMLSIFPTRQLFVPAQINFLHYNFFSIREKLYLREGIIGKIFGLTSPYPKKSTFIVGDGKSNNNTGLITDAFDNGGLLFIIIYLIIFIAILVYINSISNYWLNNPIITASFVYCMIILTDGSLLTTLLTWGMIIIIITILFINPNSKGRKYENF